MLNLIGHFQQLNEQRAQGLRELRLGMAPAMVLVLAAERRAKPHSTRAPARIVRRRRDHFKTAEPGSEAHGSSTTPNQFIKEK